MLKKLFLLITSLTVVFSLTISVSAITPYDNYTYTQSDFDAKEKNAYLPAGIIRGEDLGVGTFNGPKDVVIDSKNIYILDSGNNRIIVLNLDLTLNRVISEFVINNQATQMNSPQGLFIDKKSVLYVADTQNKRIIKHNTLTGETTEFTKPEITMLGDDYDYLPLKIAVDDANRMFVVAQGINSGMIELKDDGTFNNFYGAIQTNPSALDIFWNRFRTKEQRARLTSQIPTEYNSVNIDEQGFVYGTISALDAKKLAATMTKGNSDSSIAAVKKLNPLGNDILRRLGTYPPNGDAFFQVDTKENPLVSKISDISIMSSGIYNLLDKQMGRIFTYDYDGNLLFVFGGLGEQVGTFSMPEALDVTKDEKIYVVDSGYNQILEFTKTEYADLILNAAKSTYNMEYENSEKAWTQVMEYTSDLDLAYVGLGNSLVRQNNYKDAMHYFKLGNNKSDFSIAFSYNRDALIKQYFITAVVIIIALVAVVKTVKVIRKKRGKKNGKQA